ISGPLKGQHLEHHGLALQAFIPIRHAVRERTFASQSLLDLSVLCRDAIGVTGQRLQDRCRWMQAPPFVPAGEQERIQLEMLAFEWPGDGFEARLLPATAGL